MRIKRSFKTGQKACFTKRATPRDVRLFAQTTGDWNPLHMDEKFARKTRFKTRIVHGLWSGGLISAVLGTQLPGPGAIYLSQSLRFERPVFIGDTLRAEVVIAAWLPKKRIVKLKTQCFNQRSERVVKGTAVLMVERSRRK